MEDFLPHHGGCLAQLQNATMATRSREKKAEIGDIPAMALRYLIVISPTKVGKNKPTAEDICLPVSLKRNISKYVNDVYQGP